MTDHDALLAAIIADPKDDTPRLAYADWLEENASDVECPVCGGKCEFEQFMNCGSREWNMRKESVGLQPCRSCDATGRVSDGRRERAEFILVQVEIARVVDTVDDWGESDRDKTGLAALSNHLGDLRRRERELLEPNWPVWSSDFDVFPIGVFCKNLYPYSTEGLGHVIEFSRGFVSSLTCTWDAWRKHADAILKQQPIERCKLTVIPLNSSAELRAFLEEGDFYPEVDVPDEPVRNLKSRRWPKVEFELPRADEITFRGHRLVTDATIG